MQSYFQVINEKDSTWLRLAKGEDGNISISEVMEYLSNHQIPFDLKDLNRNIQDFEIERKIMLCPQRSFPIQEEMKIVISEDNMKATARFYPPSSDGEFLYKPEIMSDLKFRKVVYGIQEEVIDEYLKNRAYCKDYVLAVGTPPGHGKDAHIEYLFNTDLRARPTLNEDGSVDFFHLNIINHCSEGDCLARLYPEVVGEEGRDVCGNVIKPRTVKKEMLLYGRNIELSEDRRELYSKVNGHVSLVEGKVFVSNVMEVENVDNSTGNIDYDGNVQVNGNVSSNFTIHAKGNVEVRGVVEGATIIAGGNITIARGMNGMTKGVLKAEGNIIAKFFENATVEAKGYVEAGSIMHSKVMAGTEIRVGGKHGFIAGGYVCATNLIDVKTLGTELGANTIIEIGVNPTVKKHYSELQDKILEDKKTIRSSQPVLDAAKAKIVAGVKLSPEQVKHVQELSSVITRKKKEVESDEKELIALEEMLEVGSNAQVVVRDCVYPGTKIVISDVSKIIKSTQHYCRFIRSQGDVVTAGLI